MIVRRVRSRHSAAMRAVKVPLIGIAASLLIMLVPGVATAQGPEFERYTYHGSFVDTDLCGFDLHITWRFHARATTWTDASGEATRWVQHGVFSEVVRANGKVATGVDRQKVVDGQNGSLLITGSWIFFLPDGSHIQNAGRLELTYDGEILSDRGPHPIEEGRLAELFCAAMS